MNRAEAAERRVAELEAHGGTVDMAMRSTITREEMLEEHERQCNGEWYRTRWYRVVGPDGELWMESSDPDECQEAMRPGDTLQYLWAREDKEWQDVPDDCSEGRSHG
jgi:hypothetical protein